MEKKAEHSFEEYCNMIDSFAPCMDDYLYFWDIKNDLYYISKNALERFNIPTNKFTDVAKTHELFVHREDLAMLQKDLEEMTTGKKNEHNIEYRWIGKRGQSIWINCRGRILKGEDGTAAYMAGCVNEIGKKQMADNISGLKTIGSVADTFENFCRVTRAGFTLHIGIDSFKAINERFGHEYGNFVLHGVANCISQCLGPGQEVYHVNADEFLVVDYLSDTTEEGKKLYNEIRKKVDEFIQENRYEAVYTISAGILSCKDLGGMEYGEFIKLSQFTLSRAKELGKNRVYFFNLDDYKHFLRERLILSTVRETIAYNFNGFEVYYQPIMKQSDDKIPHGAEALLRYTLPNGDRVSPVEFIPVLEESGLIIPVGKWVLGQAMQFCKKVQKYIPDFKVNVNVSYVQVLKSPFIPEFFRMLKEYDMPPTAITIELTESGQLDDSAQMRQVWDNLRKYGVSLALDDFGTGYSNLMNISDMVPNVVKLDRGFTLKALKNDFERDLMANIIQMVHSLGLKICVEGIETEDELVQIRTLSPDYIQGYYYGKPCPEKEFLYMFCKSE